MPTKTFRVFTLVFVIAATAGAQVALNTLPSREVGQPILPKPNPFAVPTSNPNLVEGREFFQPQAVALDTGASPPIVYVADTGNNRILAWKNATSFANGKPADLVIGQKDFYSTAAQGPATNSASTLGFYQPSALAVFSSDLYVADTRNNRIMRFRAPFAAPAGQQLIPDLCIGQASFQSATANAPTGLTNQNGLSNPSAITFDKSGNLWVADSGNNRVLQFAAADVARSNAFNLTAKLEIGQLDFTSVQPALPNTDAGRKTRNQLATPTAISFDSVGRMYIADTDPSLGPNMSRVLVFLPQFTNGMSATRIMGIAPTPPAGTTTPLPDPQVYSVAMFAPSDVFFFPGTQGMGVVDAGWSRILLFDAYDNWPDEGTAFSPSAKAVIGHASGVTGINSHDLKSLVRNDGNANGFQSSAATFANPAAAIFFNNEVYVSDTGNNRVIVLPFANGALGNAVRLLGQDRYDSNSINLIEGREFSFIGTLSSTAQLDAGLAVDSTGDTPHLYVSDPYNHRVLGFKDIRTLKPGSPADIVIGQPDFATAICNYPSGDQTQPTQSNLCRPTGIIVDPQGNLYVADSLNHRVLRFPTPFSHTGNQVADVVLGQASFFTSILNPSSQTMGIPYGLAFAGNNGLLVSDQQYSRVLFIPFTNGTFTSADNGKAATKVFGQPDFTTITSGTSDTGMSSPRHMAADTDGRPYVVDSGNSRIMIFDQVNNLPATGAHAAVILSGASNSVSGIYVNTSTGQVWVTDLGGNRVINYPRFDTLQFNPAPTSVNIAAAGPIAVTQDQYGDLIVAESTSRVTFYFPGLSAVNGANFVINHGLAPNTIATIYPAANGSFGKETASAGDLPNPIPVPAALADVQVLLDGTPCPLYYVGPGQVNFIVPWGAATSGNSDLQVIKISTGQVMAAGLVPMNAVSPGIFTTVKVGNNVQAAVINKDGTVNSPTNPASRGDTISIYATGQGFISGAPPDGQIPSSPLNGPMPRVAIGGIFLDSVPLQPNEPGPPFVTYSGTSGYPGMWQINARVPQAVDPNSPAVVLINIQSVSSNGLTVNGVNAVMFVKQ
jgi:uncharacterized protein (TIGR03437 family)